MIPCVLVSPFQLTLGTRRVGFGQEKSKLTTVIPDNVEQLLAEFNVVEDIPTTTTWDFVWNAVVEEGREKRLQRLPFTQELDPLPPQKSYSTDQILIAEAALKVRYVGLDMESYSPHLGGHGFTSRDLQLRHRVHLVTQCR